MNRSDSFRPTASTKAAVVIVEILFYLGIVALILSIALALAVNLTAFTVRYVDTPLRVSYSDGSCLSPFGTSTSTEGPQVVGMDGLVVRHDEKGLQRVFVLIPLALAGIFLSVVMMLRRIVRSIRDGSPFTRENAARIKALGWVIALAGPFYGLLEYIYGRLMLGRISVPDELTVHVEPDGRLL